MMEIPLLNFDEFYIEQNGYILAIIPKWKPKGLEHANQICLVAESFTWINDVPWALAIHRNLLSVIMLIKLGFNVMFHSNVVNLYLKKVKYDTKYFLFAIEY